MGKTKRNEHRFKLFLLGTTLRPDDSEQSCFFLFIQETRNDNSHFHYLFCLHVCVPFSSIFHQPKCYPAPSPLTNAQCWVHTICKRPNSCDNITIRTIIKLARMIFIVSSIYQAYGGHYQKTITVSIFSVSIICPQ